MWDPVTKSLFFFFLNSHKVHGIYHDPGETRLTWMKDVESNARPPPHVYVLVFSGKTDFVNISTVIITTYLYIDVIRVRPRKSVKWKDGSASGTNRGGDRRRGSVLETYSERIYDSRTRHTRCISDNSPTYLSGCHSVLFVRLAPKHCGYRPWVRKVFVRYTDSRSVLGHGVKEENISPQTPVNPWFVDRTDSFVLWNQVHYPTP